MRKILLAALAALATSLPAAAQVTQIFPPPQQFLMGGTNVTAASSSFAKTATLIAQNDLACAWVNGTTWGTVQIATSGTFNEVLTPYVAIEGTGTNLWAAAYLERLDLVSATSTASATVTANAGTYELPISGNTRQVCLKATTYTSGTATISIAGGTLYGPGAPVKAILYDVATTAGANNNTGTLATSGWTTVQSAIIVTTANTGAAALNQVAWDGTVVPIVSTSALTSGTTYSAGFGTNAVLGALGSGSTTVPATWPVPRRLSITTTGATTSAQRIIIEASR